MAGIVSYSSYVPFCRIERGAIAGAWGGRSAGGEKAVANFDEDSITMAVEAATDCLKGCGPHSIGALYLASISLPYRLKQASALVGTAVDLPRQTSTADFTDCQRSGTSALLAAVDAVNACPSRQALVVASDCQVGAPGSDAERDLGDGAAALLVGDSDTVAEIETAYTHHDEFIGTWRMQGDPFPRSWEDRFVVTEGYMRNMREAVSTVMREQKLTPEDFSRAVLYASNARTLRTLATSLGFDFETQIQNSVLPAVGDTGTAFVMMELAQALNEARPGDRILMANYGDGADVFILRVTERISDLRARHGTGNKISSKKLLPNYEKYLRFRQVLTVEAERRRPAEETSAVAMWRDRKEVLALHGTKCRRCGTLHFPKQRVCAECQTKDEFDSVRLPRTGKLFTYCMDYLAPSLDPPMVKAVVDLDNEGRMFCQMTDIGDSTELRIDMPVEMTFRKIHEAAGFYNYFWKCRPAR
jgi:hydroxymethylglutaryl-CoA synthase